MRSFDEALSFRRPAVQAGHVGFRPGLVDEHQSPGIDAALIGPPTRAMTAYVRAVLLARDKRLFLNVTPRRRKKRLIIEVSDLTPRSHKRRSHNAESVMSVFSVRAACRKSWCGIRSLDARWPPCPTAPASEPWRSTRSEPLDRHGFKLIAGSVRQVLQRRSWSWLGYAAQRRLVFLCSLRSFMLR